MSEKIMIYSICVVLVAFALAAWLLIWKHRGNEPTIFYLMMLIGFVGVAIGGSGFILLIAYERILK